VDDAGIEREIEGVRKAVADSRGELVGVHKWGRRKLAYPIRKVHEGYYVIVRFKSEAELLPVLDRRYRLNESVLRHLTVASPGGEWPPELRSRERRPPRGERGGRDRRGGGRGYRGGPASETDVATSGDGGGSRDQDSSGDDRG
jgi:small subunit ribosomal protein S6